MSVSDFQLNSVCGKVDEHNVEFIEVDSRRLVYNVGVVKYVVDANSAQYKVIEPSIPRNLTDVVDSVVEKIRSSVNRVYDCEKYWEDIVNIARKLGVIDTVVEHRSAVTYHVTKRLSPWGFLYPIMIDPLVEEVSVIAGKTVKIIHRSILTVEYLDTNIMAPEEYEFRQFLQSLASHAGVAINPAFPIAEAEFEGHRLTMVYGSIASSSVMSIRKKATKPLSLEDLINLNMLTREAANYLLQVLLNRGMVFIVGPQGTGKTTLLNALLEKLPRDWKLVVVEDVPELRPRHPHFLSLRIRKVHSLSESKNIEIGYRELLRVALRLRGQFTGITEARGEEVIDLFEAAALGEASAATFHARDWDELKLRLFKLGVKEHMLPLLWAVVILQRVHLASGVSVRRVVAIYEIDKSGRENKIFEYDPKSDRLKMINHPSRVSLQSTL
jgi:flagellar protein FlaI